MRYLYLHGFASSPNSHKAQDLRDRYFQLGIPLLVPDLNQNDFTHLTLTRQLRQIEALLPSQPVTLIGSSFGGLTAAWLGDTHEQVDRLVLLAPAFGFLAHWLPRLGESQVQQWQTKGELWVYHYAVDRTLPLSYEFVQDAARYNEAEMQRPVPTLILHGVHDDVIPVSASRQFAQTRPWVKLVELDSDHALGNVRDRLWQEIAAFCALPQVLMD